MTETGRWIFDHAAGKLVPVPLDWRPKPRPRIAVHGVKQPFQSMADGKYYDDTRTYEKSIRAQGYIIKGNERLNPPPPSEDVGFRDALIETSREMGISIEGNLSDG